MKKIARSVSVFLLVSALCSTTAYAFDNVDSTTPGKTAAQTEKIVSGSDKIDAWVEKCIEDAQVKANDAILRFGSGSTEASQAIDKIITNLTTKTDNRVQSFVDIASKSDVEIECYYTEVQIGNTTVFVDPCRVIGD